MENLFKLAKNDRDNEARNEIVAHYRSQLAGFIRVRLSPRLREVVDVDDIVQDTFARAFQRLDNFQWQGEKAFSSWLCGIALNVLRESESGMRRKRGDTESAPAARRTVRTTESRFESTQRRPPGSDHAFENSWIASKGSRPAHESFRGGDLPTVVASHEATEGSIRRY